jgi:MoxR-like ATPase
MKSTIEKLLAQLNHGLVEREETLKAALLTVLAGENLVLIGPPGTGKSLIARRIADCLDAKDTERESQAYFEYLLTKFSTPEEIFGPLSITELKADRFRRNTAGYLPTVKMAFLDEIFKASSSILNALLTILNERIYHNGAEAQRVPLQALIAASNELPADQEELGALYDRFLMRRFVDYVSQANLPRLFDNPGPAPTSFKLVADDLRHIQEASEAVAITPEIVGVIQRIWTQHKETFKEDARESLSDRRLKKVIKLLRVSAASNGRAAVDLSDVFLLKDCLWNHPDNAVKVRDIVMQILRASSRVVPHHAEVVELAPASGSDTVLKGFEGQGTETAPFLVRHYHHLMDLERPEVGQRGYYFRQMADIDCGALTSWMNISFQGHYDGNGHTVSYRKSGDNWNALFSSILGKSTVKNLRLHELRLTNYLAGSHISHCSSTTGLISERAHGCTILSCQSVGPLVAGTALDCTISRCASNSFLITSYAKNCTFQDCSVMFDLNWSTQTDYPKLGGIASNLFGGSVVERCFVGGRIANAKSGDMHLHGIAYQCETGTIRACAIGKLELSGAFVRLENRIAREIGQLQNNASLDSNPGTDSINGKDGRSVAAALFKQHYFEHTLGWDFDTVWQWDSTQDRPVLRASEGSCTAQQVPSKVRMTDLLTQQMQANIWV